MKNTKQLEKIKQDLNSFLLELGCQISDLISITPVGSHAEPGKEFDKINDYDIVFVFEELKKSDFKYLISELEKFAKERQTDEIDVIVETRAGSLKIAGKKEITFQIHAIILDMPALKFYENNCQPVLYDWYRFDPIYGKHLSQISNCGLTADSIINSIGGIRFWQNRLKNKMQGANKIIFKKDGSHELEELIFEMDDRQLQEDVQKSVITTLQNIYKIESGENQKIDIKAEVKDPDHALQILEKLENDLKK